MKLLFSARLKELMKSFDLNQVQLEQKTGLKQNTISQWLNNVNEPSITSLWILADFFDVEVDYLIGRKDYS